MVEEVPQPQADPLSTKCPRFAPHSLERPLHTLRHSQARALRRVEAPLEAVQAALDHSNLATSSIYLRQLEGQEDP